MMDPNDMDDMEEESGQNPEEENIAYVKFSPEDIDMIFTSVHSGIELLHNIMANLYQNYQKKIVDYDVLKIEVDTKKDELNKYKDELLKLYSNRALKPKKKKGKEENEL